MGAKRPEIVQSSKLLVEMAHSAQPKPWLRSKNATRVLATKNIASTGNGPNGVNGVRALRPVAVVSGGRHE